MLLSFLIVLLKKGQYTLIVLEGYLLRLWETFKVRHVSPSGRQHFKHILGQGSRVELEICFEEQIDGVVDAPFA